MQGCFSFTFSSTDKYRLKDNKKRRYLVTITDTVLWLLANTQLYNIQNFRHKICTADWKITGIFKIKVIFFACWGAIYLSILQSLKMSKIWRHVIETSVKTLILKTSLWCIRIINVRGDLVGPAIKPTCQEVPRSRN